MASAIVGFVVCSQCGEREADIFIRRNVADPESLDPADRTVDLALCESCARARGLIVGKGRLDLRIGEILDSALTGDELGDQGGSPSARCPVCGIDLGAVLREGRLGCSGCVDAFRPALRRLLRRPPERLGGPAAHPETVSDSRRPEALPPSDRSRPFPFGFPAFDGGDGEGNGRPDSDVVLETVAILSRNLTGLPFVGNPRASAAPSRAILGRLLGQLEDFRSQAMGALPASWRRTLAERAFVPRSYASDPEAPLAASLSEPVYVLSDDVDHLRIVARVGGFDPARALSIVARYADLVCRYLPVDRRFAADEEFGWICARLEDCGTGLSTAAVLHLPALVMTGLHERFFKSALAEGAVVRGLYSLEGEASAGSVYELSVGEARNGRSPEELLAALVEAAVRAERRARESLAENNSEALRDAAGRAYGTARYARKIEASEGLQLASRLRLASLLGLLRGVEAKAFDPLLEGLGPGSLAREAGLDSLPDRGQEDMLRARRLRSAISSATVEEGGD